MIVGMKHAVNLNALLKVYRAKKPLATKPSLPGRCLLCNDITNTALCAPCAANLPLPKGYCPRCAEPLPHKGIECGRCQQQSPPVSDTYAALRYEWPVDRLIQQFKFNRNLVAGRALANAMAQTMATQLQQQKKPDYLLPMPLHHSRLRGRQFNQAGELANQLGELLNIPVLNHHVLRKRATRTQSLLNARERRRNMRGAFTTNSSVSLAGKHIAIVDDVMTTGNSVFSLAKTLKKAGVTTVDAWVAARAPNKHH